MNTQYNVRTSDLRVCRSCCWCPLSPLPELDLLLRLGPRLRLLRLEHGLPEILDHAGALPHEDAGNQEEEDDGQSDGDVGSCRHFGALGDDGDVLVLMVECGGFFGSATLV